MSAADANHREALAAANVARQDIAIQQASKMHELLEANTNLTEQVERLTREIHAHVVGTASAGAREVCSDRFEPDEWCGLDVMV